MDPQARIESLQEQNAILLGIVDTFRGLLEERNTVVKNLEDELQKLIKS